MKTVAIIVTYNRKKLLLECIDSLEKQTKNETLDILVVDNASTDATDVELEPLVKAQRIMYQNTGCNLGGAGGFEYGVLAVMNAKYDYVWIMDDDTIPTKNALEEFYSFAKEKPDFGFLSSLVKWTDGSICTMNVQRKNIFKKLSSFNAEVIPIQYATFVSLFISSETIREVGAPIGDFFIWGDDWEFTRRISQKYNSYLIKNSIVIHKTIHNQGCNISNDIVERIPRYKLNYRNKLFIAKQEKMKGYIYYILTILKDILMVIFKNVDNKQLRIETILAGVLDGIKFEPEIKKYNGI